MRSHHIIIIIISYISGLVVVHLEVATDFCAQKVAVDYSVAVFARRGGGGIVVLLVVGVDVERAYEGVKSGFEEEGYGDSVGARAMDYPVERGAVEPVCPDLPHFTDVADECVGDWVGGDPGSFFFFFLLLFLGTV
jgi:hypothetical protein